MENFEEIIKPLLEKRHYVKTIKIGAPPKIKKHVINRPPKPVITPLGRFASAIEAADAHGISKTAMYSRIYQKQGYRYDEQE